MNYELAKELKDAGFPQEERGGFMLPPKPIPVEIPEEKWSDFSEVYVPTFEELIEACGDEYWMLELIVEKNTRGWKIHTRSFSTTTGVLDRCYPTPTEAVAMLYLALHGKKQNNTDA